MKTRLTERQRLARNAYMRRWRRKNRARAREISRAASSRYVVRHPRKFKASQKRYRNAKSGRRCADCRSAPAVGRKSYCNPCSAVRAKRYRDAREARDPGYYRRKALAYYHTHRDQQLRSTKRWRKRNKAHVRDLHRAWRTANPEYYRQYYQDNKAVYAAGLSAWQRHNPDKLAGYTAKHNALKHGVGCDLTEPQWRSLLKNYRHRCAYCRKKRKLEREHAMPLSRGGAHTLCNVVPACRSCNASKATQTPLEWFLRYS